MGRIIGDGSAGADHSLDLSRCSVESLLSVPVAYIFRETRTGHSDTTGTRSSDINNSTPNRLNKSRMNFQRNFLFSRGEVSALIRISFLASELDAMLSLAYEALDRSQKCMAYCRMIGEASEMRTYNNPTLYLRALLPLLDVHASTSNVALNHATSEFFGITRVLNELNVCAAELGKFAEQNLLIADQFEWAMIPGQNNILSIEKRAIAEIELGCCERIQNLSSMATVPSEEICQSDHTIMSHYDGAGENVSIELDAFDKTCTGDIAYCSMTDLCQKVFQASVVEEVAQMSDRMQDDEFPASQISVSVTKAAATLQVMGSRGL